MKNITFLFILWCQFAWSQNLVPNPSFEEYDRLPNSMLDSGHEFQKMSKFWTAANLASTDLISPRFKTKKFKAIPAHSGNMMAGIVIHGDFWSEYVRVKLREKLVPNTTYYIEFWVAYNKDYHKSKVAPNKNVNFGAYIGKKYFQKDTKVIHAKPQVSPKSTEPFIPNKWIKISGSFTAKSEDNFLYIGQFLDDNNPTPLMAGYFYIDDVLVERFIDVSKVYNPKNTTPDGLNNIYFETDKYDLLPQSFLVLNDIVKYLEKNPSIKVEIIGHTDSVGVGYHNQELSENRAKSVKNYLINNGIDKKRLTSKGLGSSKPIATNETEAGRQENRRVEFLASSKLVSKRDIREVDQNEIDINYSFSKTIKKPENYLNIGRYDLVMKCNTNDHRDIDAIKTLKSYTRNSAKQFILKKAATKNIVCINDGRLKPQTRVFTKSLLKEMYDLGFHHLAVGDLVPSAQKINARGYPATTDGKYIKEPAFGEMIREAIKIGYTIFPYAPTTSEIKKAKKILKRDKSLAKDKNALSISANHWCRAMNIIRQINRNNGIKVLVYTSKNGIREQPFNHKKYLAYWLRKLGKGADPLTIDQVEMLEDCGHQSPFVNAANVNQATVFSKSDISFTDSKDKNKPFDIQVFLPKTKYKDKRPQWVNIDDQKRKKTINLDKYGFSYPCLLLVYNKNEDFEEAVPVDAIEITAQQHAPIMIYEGKYRLIMKDRQKRKTLEFTMN